MTVSICKILQIHRQGVNKKKKRIKNDRNPHIATSSIQNVLHECIMQFLDLLMSVCVCVCVYIIYTNICISQQLFAKLEL